MGIDNAKSLEIVKSRAPKSELVLIPGSFPDVEVTGSFDKILIYGVVLYMRTERDLFDFISSALDLLDPAGRMLIGDITTTGRKKRFVDSQRGKAFEKSWAESLAAGPRKDNFPIAPSGDHVIFTDELVMEILLHIRKKGWHAYLYEQPQDLPFGNTREDILIVGPEYSDRM